MIRKIDTGFLSGQTPSVPKIMLNKSAERDDDSKKNYHAPMSNGGMSNGGLLAICGSQHHGQRYHHGCENRVGPEYLDVAQDRCLALDQLSQQRQMPCA